MRGGEGRFQGTTCLPPWRLDLPLRRQRTPPWRRNALTAAHRAEPGSPAQTRSCSVRLALIYAPGDLLDDLIKAQFYVVTSHNLG